MPVKNFNYFSILMFHVAVALVIFVLPFLSVLYALGILILGSIYIIKKQNRNNEVLIVAAYITGAEVFLRATGGAPVYEFGKYGVMIVIAIGMYYSGFSRNAMAYWVYLILLIPGVLIAATVLSNSVEDRKIISFVISGPVCLGFCALYTYQRKITYSQLNNILLALALPILTLTTYLILYNPSVRDVITGTDSNVQASGGFGPNQVSTVLGIGIFVFVLRALLQSQNLQTLLLNLGIAGIITFRAIVTFSRGGVFTAIAMISLLIIGTYFKFNGKAKVKLNYFILVLTISTSLIWGYSLLQTNGLIGKRYANQDAAGRVKESRFTGREELGASEINAFLANPVLGVGVGKTIDDRLESTGVNTASHNEITRLLAEHGSLGILILLILFFTPIILHFDNRENFFMLPLLAFWLLTINHAAMRIAAPAFIYSLALLKVHIVPPKPRVKSHQAVL